MSNFSIIPKKTNFVFTKNRKIISKIPSPKTIDILEKCMVFEPKSMNNQIPIVWDRAEGFNVYDIEGNKWIDFTSTIFVANVGHSNPRIINSIKKMLDKSLLNAYYYPTEIRAQFSEYMINDVFENKYEKILLLSTGSEANESAIKMAKIRCLKKNKNNTCKLISFTNSFHGKTLGSQLAGGKEKEKYWIKNDGQNNIHIQFPYPWILKELNISGADFFKKTINELLLSGLDFSDVAAFITEPYQGWCAVFLPNDYAKELENFCRKNDILLIMDEVQSGFGRTGKTFAYEHFDIHPDIIVCGKAISSSLPLSAVITNSDIFGDDESFNSTHGGNPLAVAASLESVKIMKEDNLVFESYRKGLILEKELMSWKEENPNQIKEIYCKGLLASVFIESNSEKINNIDFVDLIIEEATRRGLMSIRTSSGTLKIGPPLIISDDALIEGIEVLKESLKEINKCLDI
jgi:4-aminobutyrate aminotransferase-like enzyme